LKSIVSLGKLLGLENLNSGCLVEVNRLEDLQALTKVLAKLEIFKQLDCQLVLRDLVKLYFSSDWHLVVHHLFIGRASEHLNLKGNCFTESIAVGTTEGQSQVVDFIRLKSVTMNLNWNLQLNSFHGLERLVHADVDRLTRHINQLNRIRHSKEDSLLPGPLGTITYFDRHHKKLAREHVKRFARHVNDLGALDLPRLFASFAATLAGTIGEIPLLSGFFDLGRVYT